METKDLILIEHFCMHNEIEFSFIESLQKFGLIEIITQDDDKYFATEHLNDIEKMTRLHFELDINMEGIDAVSQLLKKIHLLQSELISAHNKLRIYEED